MRYLPDYADYMGWVEVKGFGRDRKLKLKFDTIEALSSYNDHDPVRLFVYDSHRSRWCVLEDWQVVADTFRRHGVRGRYSEGNRYLSLHFDQLEEHLQPKWHTYDKSQTEDGTVV
jgi:hypothetical protein